MNVWQIIKDVMRPGHPEFKAHLSQVTESQSRMLRALHLLDSRGTEQLRKASDSAAEFR